jgi:hypothetical protein
MTAVRLLPASRYDGPEGVGRVYGGGWRPGLSARAERGAGERAGAELMGVAPVRRDRVGVAGGRIVKADATAAER